MLGHSFVAYFAELPQTPMPPGLGRVDPPYPRDPRRSSPTRRPLAMATCQPATVTGDQISLSSTSNGSDRVKRLPKINESKLGQVLASV